MPQRITVNEYITQRKLDIWQSKRTHNIIIIIIKIL